MVVDGVEINCSRMRDDQVVQKVIYANPPMTCDDISDCPGGSFCRPGPNNIGTCDLQCDPNNKCQNGSYCSCDGVCIPLNGTVPPGGVPSPSACPRNTTLLQDPNTKKRACEFDDGCPFGSHCDKGTGRCDWTCLGDSTCTAGTHCSCGGVCVADTAISHPPTSEPRLAVAPLSFLLPKKTPVPLNPDWGSSSERSMDVDVSVPFLNRNAMGMLEDGPQPTVFATPDPNLRVKCETLAADGTVIGTPTFSAAGEPCKFEGTVWHYKQLATGESFRARNRVTVTPVTPQAQPPATQPSPASAWSVRLSGEGLADAPVSVTLRYATSALPADTSMDPWTEVSTSDILGESATVDYKGTFKLTSADGNLTLPVQVEARLTYFGLNVHDSFRLLTPNGLLELGVSEPSDRGAPAPVQRWVDRGGRDARAAGAAPVQQRPAPELQHRPDAGDGVLVPLGRRELPLDPHL
jgi:hypothetical protein